jgi:hypothetical protein
VTGQARRRAAAPPLFAAPDAEMGTDRRPAPYGFEPTRRQSPRVGLDR